MTPEEVTTKYDPCRRFKKGDIVQIITHKGRHYDEDAKARHLSVLPVTEDEGSFGIVELLDSGFYFEIDPAYLTLVTPVEELEQEPYYVGKAEINTTDGEYDTWAVFDEHGYIVAQFAEEAYKPGEAKARAEQECDSRNAEHREEQE